MKSLPDISDKYSDEIQIGKLILNSYGKIKSVAGEIYTVSCSDDNSIVKKALASEGNNKVLNVEKIFVGKRLRHFGVKESGDIFLSNENYFYITADKDGLYKVKFDKFR